MKQKIVINLPTVSNQKSRSKAMNIAVGVDCVNSASWAGPEKTQLEVAGDGIDPVRLVCLLRKKFGSAELETVAPVEEKKDDKKKDDKKKDDKKKDDCCKPCAEGWPWTSPTIWPYGCVCCPPYY